MYAPGVKFGAFVFWGNFVKQLQRQAVSARYVLAGIHSSVAANSPSPRMLSVGATLTYWQPGRLVCFFATSNNSHNPQLWEKDTLDPDDLLANVTSSDKGDFKLYGSE